MQWRLRDTKQQRPLRLIFVNVRMLSQPMRKMWCQKVFFERRRAKKSVDIWIFWFFIEATQWANHNADFAYSLPKFECLFSNKLNQRRKTIVFCIFLEWYFCSFYFFSYYILHWITVHNFYSELNPWHHWNYFDFMLMSVIASQIPATSVFWMLSTILDTSKAGFSSFWSSISNTGVEHRMLFLKRWKNRKN